jgi:ribonuclease HI
MSGFRKRAVLQDWDIFEDVPKDEAAAAELARRISAAYVVQPPAPKKARAKPSKAKQQDALNARESFSAYADDAMVALQAEADAEGAAAEAKADEGPALLPPPHVEGLARIYTDGSCLGNGKAGCFAGIGVFFGPDDPRNVSWVLRKGKPSNQNAELQALHIATEEADRMLREGEVREVEVLSDSQYGINCATVWYRNWVRNNWVNSTGKPVAHREWIEPIALRLELWKGRLRLVKIKAHVGMWGNEQADELARTAAERARAAWQRRVAENPDHEDAPKAVIYTNPSRRPHIKPEFEHTKIPLGASMVEIVQGSA